MHEFVRASYLRLVERDSTEMEDGFVFVPSSPTQRERSVRRRSYDSLLKRFRSSWHEATYTPTPPRATHTVVASAPMDWDVPDAAFDAKQVARAAGYSNVIAFTAFNDASAYYPPRSRQTSAQRFSRRLSAHS
jgi:hypothetical protein